MTTRQILEEAIVLLEKGWTKGTWARNKAGRSCNPFSKNAVAWDAEGATMVASKGDDAAQFKAWVRFFKGAGLKPFDDATEWNDRQATKQPVIAAMNRALRKRS